MAGAVLRTGGEVGTAVIACAAVAKVAPGAAKDACRAAAVGGAASVTNGVGNIRNANADKKKYQDCKKNMTACPALVEMVTLQANNHLGKAS